MHHHTSACNGYSGYLRHVGMCFNVHINVENQNIQKGQPEGDSFSWELIFASKCFRHLAKFNFRAFVYSTFC